MSTSTRSKRSLLADGSWHDWNGVSSETLPFLNRGGGQRSRKTPFFQPRPLWLVLFVVASAFVRGMTLAPRVQIYLQLSCSNLRAGEWNPPTTVSLWPHTVRTAVDPGVPHTYPSTFFPPHNDVDRSYNSTTVIFSAPFEAQGNHGRARIRRPSCASGPAVQAGAIRFQTIMTSIVGFLSAFTSGSWGAFSDRHGRTMVLAISTLGLLLTDLIFVSISTLAIPLSRHGHNLLILAPIIEGLLGGSSTLQAAISSYIRLYYVGFLLGPLITGHHLLQPSVNSLGGRIQYGSEKTDLSIFWIAIACSFINFLLALFVLPESLGKEWRTELEYHPFGNKGKTRMIPVTPVDDIAAGMGSIQQPEIAVVRTEGHIFRFPVNGQAAVRQFLKPLIVFWPVQVLRISRKRRDWNLTLLAGGLFFYMLSTGIFQMRYLYATHTYDWGVHQLSYYISYMGTLRVVFLLVLFPAVIGAFKQNRAAGMGTTVTRINNSITAGKKSTLDSSVVKSKTKPTRSQLGRELALTRFSLIIDIVAHSLVIIMPAPAVVQHMGFTGHQNPSLSISQTAFIVASTLSCFGVGLIPVAQSLALSLFQLREPKNPGTRPKKIERTGELFGAFAVLQAIGQTLLAPIAFGSMYSETVARFPKAIFVSGAMLCTVALVTISFVKGAVGKNSPSFKSQAPTQRKRGVREFERGRSRVSKDLRGSSIPSHPRGPSYGTIVNEFADASERV